MANGWFCRNGQPRPAAYVLAAGGTQLVIGASNGWDPIYLAAAGKR